MLSILFVTTGLQTGGAEKMLVKMLAHLDRSRFDPWVVSLMDEGTQGAAIRKMGISVSSLRVNTLCGFLSAPWRLAQLMRRKKFEVIQGWMYHGNIFAWLGRVLSGSNAALCFGIRQTLSDIRKEKMHTRLAIRANAILAPHTESCLFNSLASLEKHQAYGFRSRDMSVIPNGFELDSFFPDPIAAGRLRTELTLHGSPVVGLVARFDAAKDHYNFLVAAAKIRSVRQDVTFVMAGRNIVRTNDILFQWIKELKLEDAVVMLGERSDVAQLNNMFDVACLSSYMEAFPNVIGEAMACGIPCAATNVGDCKAIIGDSGSVVPPRDPSALAMAVLNLLALSTSERSSLGAKGRERITEHFDVKKIVGQYEVHYENMAGLN
ncbi:MAG TPA: glycosyltransferase [Candidimonas sp.]|nr:glycosyltransferase [Candidimonas sp.]